jgi:hypothetical protein
MNESTQPRAMTAEDIGLVIKESAPNFLDIENQIAELESKLNSTDFSDQEKGAFEEERDNLKRELAKAGPADLLKIKIAKLESKLNSADFSDQQKGAFEEERDNLKKELAEQSTPAAAETNEAAATEEKEPEPISEAAPVEVEMVPEAEESTPEEVGSVERDAELEKIEDAVEKVAAGEEAEVTLEVPADIFSKYDQSLKATIGLYGETLKTTIANNEKALEEGIEDSKEKKAAQAGLRGAERELKSFEKKEASFSQSRESLEFVKQKLEDPSLSPEDRAKLEKQAKVLEIISGKLDRKRQLQDRNLLEKGGEFFKEQIAERWRKGKWYNKAAISIGLSVASFGIAAPFLRSLCC